MCSSAASARNNLERFCLLLRIATTLSVLPLVPPLMAAERRDVGLTQKGDRIEATIVPGATAEAPTVLLVGGLNGSDQSSRIVTREVQAFEGIPQSRRRFRLVAIPLANPDRSGLVFPPTGTAYRDNSESHALWRWTAVQAPDLAVIVGHEDFGLADALAQNPVAGVGRIPTRRAAPQIGILSSLVKPIPPSEARREIERRRSRSPKQLADELARHYGHDFDQLTYIPGMSLIGQLRLGRLAEVQQLAAPYLDGTTNPLARPSSLVLAGHLVFAELAERTGDSRYLQMVRRVADLGFTEAGEMKESMPYHEEMSDSIFMAGPIVARAGTLTGERKYFDMTARHVAFMQKLVLRPDGLYRHSPLTDAAWGRGNAFPALGLALTLSEFPKDHPELDRMVKAFQQHMAVLARFQDEDGLWRQVIDHPGSYPEFSATAMIATAFLYGVRDGWLPSGEYQPRIDRAWRAVAARVGASGQLLDVCESTNKQPSFDAYLRRAAILDRDPRGGGMALFFATEMARLQ